MAYVDIHTHTYKPDPEIASIENISGNFLQLPADHIISAGLHPWRLHDADEQFNTLRIAARNKNVAAIGECGLDKLARSDWGIQVQFFEAQLQLATDLNKPVIIHCVKAFPETLAMLKGIGVPVIFHGINNKLSLIEPVITNDFYLSFGKSLLHATESICTSLNAVPIPQLFLETDDSNVPIKNIYVTAAEIRNIPENELVLQLQKNYHSVFRYAGS